ncbi:MAG: hypothetical protein HOP29_03155 [Phycisphaerales bacterium]|nr:hypothetical protein [Phycisphaerales bacterium]
MAEWVGKQASGTGATARGIELRDIVDVWYRRRWTIMALIVLTIMGVEIANYVIYPIFESRVKILIEGQSGLDVPFSRENLVFKKTEITQTQCEILICQPNLAQVVTNLKLDERADPSGSLRDTIHAGWRRVVRFYKDTKEGAKRFVVESVFHGTYKSPRLPTGFDRAVGYLQDDAVVRVEPMTNTDFVILTVRDRDPELAAVVANTLADVFVKSELAARVARAQDVRESVDRQLEVRGPELHEAREAVARFKREHGIVAIDRQIDAVLEKLSLLELSYWDLSQKEEVRALSAWDSVRRESSAIRDLSHREKTALIDKLSELAELETKYQPDHPRVVAARAAVAEVQDKLDEARDDKPQAEDPPAEDAESLRASLMEEITRVRAELSELSEMDTRYQDLVMDVENSSEVYKFLINKREDASIAQFTTQPQGRIVEPAIPSFKPVRPSKWMNRGLGLLASIAVAVGLCAALEYLDRTLRTPEAVSRLVGLRTLGSVPYVGR